ncbi:MAG: hypothetical protein V5B34_19145 [Accumulibacter sp.]|jgi:hypothetical protein
MVIRDLFDPSRNIDRIIEKVITYGACKEERFKAEISEYVVTDSIDEQTEKLLGKMQAAMEAGGQNEVGVWVSGFYGSGKSSFTKYLGLAFDERITIDGLPFLKHLQDRYHRPQTRALLSAIARRFPAAVVILDLASEQLAGATIAGGLHRPVLQGAAMGRLLAQPQSGRLGAQTEEGRALRRVPGALRAGGPTRTGATTRTTPWS